jgi:hypothetical protein
MKIRIATKLTILLLLASLFPLLLFGGVSLWQLMKATQTSVIQGNFNVGQRAAEQIDQYVENALTLLASTAENINHADLKDWQKERILKNYINRFKEFNEMTLWNPQEKAVATSRLEEAKLSTRVQEALRKGFQGEAFLSPVFIKEDLTPAMLAAYPVYRLTEVTGFWWGNSIFGDVAFGGPDKNRQLRNPQVIDHSGHLIATRTVAANGSLPGENFEPAQQLPAEPPHGTEFVVPSAKKCYPSELG